MPGQNLTRAEAQARSSLLAVQTYEVTLDLTGPAPTFATQSQVSFTCSSPGPDTETFIDFIGDGVHEIVLNGVRLDPDTHYRDDRVRLPGLQAHNTVLIAGTGRYMNSGEGLHRMVDPADGEVYLYTQFEVADCRRMFPVFEQPDLKASFAFTVTAPARWSVISNEPTPEPVPAAQTWTNEQGRSEPCATWSFAPTAHISCYITALVAGPYEVVRDEVTTRAGIIPLGVYCRASLREFLDAENILDCTKIGFAFFESLFDQPFPFTKYDQLFVPEYNAGAMENAGCVTFAEIYVFRAKVTDAIIERRALTILHELAHMWFGNLVTMSWWDDLWLNESFAEWTSTLCQAEATQWTEAWSTFATAEKEWAYAQDQLSSTHPIAADMVDLDSVGENFDGITYAKGASVLKQLVAYVGRDAFIDGVRAYFVAHQWGNTQLSDLLAELERTSGRDLRRWSQAWLETAGVNTLRPVIEVDDAGIITSFAIEQSASPEQPTLRPHRLAVGLFDREGQQLVRRASIEVDLDGARTDLPQLRGQRRGEVVLVNDQDLTYAKIRLDDQSLAAVLADPRALPDSLSRGLVLAAAWDMTRDAELAARDYLELALTVLADERDSNLIKGLLAQAVLAASRYTAPGYRDRALSRLAAGLRDLALAAEPGTDAQLQLVSAFAGRAHERQDLDLVRGWLEASSPLPGLDLDTEMRWTLLTSLVAGGAAGAQDIDAEERRDATSAGAQRAARARAAMPTAAAKEEAWQRVVHDPTTPNEVLRAIAVGFARAHDRALLEPFMQRYFQDLDAVWKERTQATASDITGLMFPGSLAHEPLREMAQEWLAAHPQAHAGARRGVAENRDGVARALRAQAYDATRD